MDIKVLIATHKRYWMPEDSVYLPIHVGKAGKADLGYAGDDTGDNISEKNAGYSELTALYWAWKNLDAYYVGLVHYRRHFTTANPRDTEKKRQAVLQRAGFESILRDYPIIVPDKRRYYIETNYSHYTHAHCGEDLQMTRAVIDELCPWYTQAFDTVMKRTWAHMFNMFVMRKDYFSAYCEWMFSILFALENRMGSGAHNGIRKRLFGYVSELLLDVWLETNGLPYKEVNVCFMEKQNWVKKGGGFLLRKLRALSTCS